MEPKSPCFGTVLRGVSSNWRHQKKILRFSRTYLTQILQKCPICAFQSLKRANRALLDDLGEVCLRKTQYFFFGHVNWSQFFRPHFFDQFSNRICRFWVRHMRSRNGAKITMFWYGFKRGFVELEAPKKNIAFFSNIPHPNPPKVPYLRVSDSETRI